MVLQYDDETWSTWSEKAPTKPITPGACQDPWYQTPSGRHFPFPHPRPGQIETVEAIRKRLEEGYRVLVNGGTGFGKSPTMMALAATYGSAWVLVGKNDLVEQYRDDYEHLIHVGFLKSRQQFRCTVIPGQDCGQANTECTRRRSAAMSFINSLDGDIPQFLTSFETKGKDRQEIIELLKETVVDQSCNYKLNRDFSLRQNYTVMTVQMALTVMSYLSNHPAMRTRDLMIVDECSELEDELLSFYSLEISTNQIFDALHTHSPFREGIDYIPPPNNLQEAKEWIDAISALVAVHAESLEKDPDNYDTKRAGAIISISRKIASLHHGFKLMLPYHFERQETKWSGNTVHGHSGYKVIIKPQEARGLYDRVFGEMARRHVFCSATTGTKEIWQATHQMNQAITYLEVGSPFPVENRPIIYRPLANLTRKKIDLELPLMAKRVIDIIRQSGEADERFNHVDQKGIIHTHTNRITNAVAESIQSVGMGRRMLILQGSGKQRSEIMKIYRSSPDPLILISPSAMMGISLDDELGRWQILVKTPYPSLGDETVKYRQTNIKDWYSWQTTKNIIQACGRIVRSPEDWGITYIVDESFGNHLRWNGGQFPRWWKDAYQEYDQRGAFTLPSLPPVIGRA